jgi:hypothetical protein
VDKLRQDMQHGAVASGDRAGDDGNGSNGYDATASRASQLIDLGGITETSFLFLMHRIDSFVDGIIVGETQPIELYKQR